MQKENLIPLITGLILGLLLMFFWQLGARLNNNSVRLSQLEQAAATNAQTIEQVVNFINSATAPAESATPNTNINLEQ